MCGSWHIAYRGVPLVRIGTKAIPLLLLWSMADGQTHSVSRRVRFFAQLRTVLCGYFVTYVQ